MMIDTEELAEKKSENPQTMIPAEEIVLSPEEEYRLGEVVKDARHEMLSMSDDEVEKEMQEAEVRAERLHEDIPTAAWSRKMDQVFADHKEFQVSMLEGLRLAGLGYRMWKYLKRERSAGRVPIMDPFSSSRSGPIMGVPLGGIGGGSIGRGWRGEFVKWQVGAGLMQVKRVEADQFSVFIEREPTPTNTEGASTQSASSSSKTTPPAANKPNEKIATVLRAIERLGLQFEKLVCRQVSPVIPHNYKESSYPVGTFIWKIENTGTTTANVSLMFSFQNGTGSEADLRSGHVNKLFRKNGVVGVLMSHKQLQVVKTPKKKKAPGVTVSYLTKWETSNRQSAGKLWKSFSTDGTLSNEEDNSLSAKGKSIGAALAAKVSVPPGETREVVFGLSWDSPIARFALGTAYYRRYTRFYGASDIVDGGTIWTNGSLSKLNERHGEVEDENYIGHFAYLESQEYRMYNTYDVHFYASFALAMLWPKLELSLQRDIALATLVSDVQNWELMGDARVVPRKVRGAVPHDMGNPGEDPWLRYLHIQDISRWKDLPSKFVLQVYRDYVLTKDLDFIKDVWGVIELAITRLAEFDSDGDGIVDNEGFPDQTYDTWNVTGCSAYCGGLWLASLSAAAEMANLLGHPEKQEEYLQMLAKGQETYEKKLWNGQYYKYDCSGSSHSDSIMADQLAGQWYARACGLPPIVPIENAKSALKTVFEYLIYYFSHFSHIFEPSLITYTFNVKKFGDGELGAVNGMRPNGKVDTTCLQSVEVWTGTTYAVAAAMIQEGLIEEGLETAKGIIIPTYIRWGYQFQTPEAWDITGGYRAFAYMRPLSIWAIQWALEKRQKEGEKGNGEDQ